MQIFIYRASDGRKYPALVLRILLAVFFTVVYFIVVKGSSIASDLNAGMLMYLLISFVIQEYIFRAHLWNSRKYDPIKYPKTYLILQAFTGIFIPVSGLLLSLICTGELRAGAGASTLLFHQEPEFYLEAVMMVNAVYYGCFLASDGYTMTFIFTNNKEVKTYEAEEIGCIITVEGKCMMGSKEEWLATDLTPLLKKQLDNLNPSVFTVLKKGLFVNQKIYSVTDPRFNDHISRITIKAMQEWNAASS